jgi:outer membrane biosynthesis protein TonB
MSYESRFSDRTNPFLQPTKIALVISLGLHLLIYKFGLPNFGLNFDNGLKREVSIIELSPEQQARLPDLEPQVDIPELPNTPLDSSAPPFALPPSINPSFGNFPNLPPIDLPPPPDFDISSLPPFPTTDIKLPPIGDLSDLPSPPPLDSLDPDTPLKPPATKPTPGKPPTQPAASPKAPTTETQKPETPPQVTATQRQQSLNKNVRSLSSSLKKQQTGTTDEDARKNYVAWLSEIKDVKPEGLAIDGTYPRDACIRRLAGTSVYGVIVDTKGKVAAVDLIKGAEYPLFNEQAVLDIRDRTFANKTNKAKPYQVTVNYEYDAETCPSLSLPSLLRDKPAQPKTPTKPPAAETPDKPATPAKPPAATETPDKPATPAKPPATETPDKPATPAKPPAAETPAKPATPAKPPATETPAKPPTNETPDKPQQPSLRERLRNAPLLPDDRF